MIKHWIAGILTSLLVALGVSPQQEAKLGANERYFGNQNLTGIGSIVSSGSTATTTESGAGTRLMWIPAKAAFRAGILVTRLVMREPPLVVITR